MKLSELSLGPVFLAQASKLILVSISLDIHSCLSVRLSVYHHLLSSFPALFGFLPSLSLLTVILLPLSVSLYIDLKYFHLSLFLFSSFLFVI